MNIKGLTTRRTRSGVGVLRLHYSADPERNLDWVTQERQKYSSRAAWDREQEIIQGVGNEAPNHQIRLRVALHSPRDPSLLAQSRPLDRRG